MVNKPVFSALALLACLAFGAVQAADQGPRRYAEGAFDAATGAYTVVKGDELAAIAQRFGVTVAELKAQNKLASDEIKSDQKLVMATGTTEAGPSGAPQITGVPGSPSATTTIPGTQLPPPDPKFGGVIKEKASESKAWWAPRVVPPKGAPNVLLIMTDDQGFGAPSTFGGVIPTPAMDRIARAGLRYTNFHSTSLCSPTRAALITGRNHHSVGFGVVGEVATGFPGYDSIIPIEKGTIGTILKENGYATSWFGKDHNTPSYQSSQAGPFHQWPNGMGFEYFYGFVGGDASQWQPNLFRNTTAIYPFQQGCSTLLN
jgi:arylsulfatase